MNLIYVAASCCFFFLSLSLLQATELFAQNQHCNNLFHYFFIASVCAFVCTQCMPNTYILQSKINTGVSITITYIDNYYQLLLLNLAYQKLLDAYLKAHLRRQRTLGRPWSYTHPAATIHTHCTPTLKSPTHPSHTHPTPAPHPAQHTLALGRVRALGHGTVSPRQVTWRSVIKWYFGLSPRAWRLPACFRCQPYVHWSLHVEEWEISYLLHS